MTPRFHFVASYSLDGVTQEESRFVSEDISKFIAEANINRKPEGIFYTFARLLGIAQGDEGNWVWQSDELKACSGN